MNAKKRNDQTVTVDHPFFSTGADPLLHSGGRPPARSNARLDWRQALGVALIVGRADLARRRIRRESAAPRTPTTS